jgi:hypothetical protein
MVFTRELFSLQNKVAIIHPYSRFNSHPMYQDPETGKTFLGSWNPPIFPLKETDKSLMVTPQFAYRPDIISYEYYNTPLLAWVICYVNDIVNPYDKDTGIYPGLILRIPDITTVTAALTL